MTKAEITTARAQLADYYNDSVGASVLNCYRAGRVSVVYAGMTFDEELAAVLADAEADLGPIGELGSDCDV